MNKKKHPSPTKAPIDNTYILRFSQENAGTWRILIQNVASGKQTLCDGWQQVNDYFCGIVVPAIN